MGPKLIGMAAATVALAVGHGHDAASPQGAISRPPHPPTPTPTPGRPGPPRAVRLTIGVSGDLLPHLPIVARAHALAGGRGYDFGPMLRPIRGWVGGNSLSFCHIETPLTPATPIGYPRFSSPPAIARAVAATGFDACSTASNHSLDRGQAGVDATRRALARAGVESTGSFSSRRQRRRPLLLAARGVRVAFLAYTQMTNGIPLPHRWSVNLARAGRILTDAHRARRAGARVVIVNLHWGTEFRHAPDAFQLSPSHGGWPAHARSPPWSASTPTWCSRSGASATSGSCSARATCCPTRPPRAALQRAKTGCWCACICASPRAAPRSSGSPTCRSGYATPTTWSCLPPATSARRGVAPWRWSAAPAESRRRPEPIIVTVPWSTHQRKSPRMNGSSRRPHTIVLRLDDLQRLGESPGRSVGVPIKAIAAARRRLGCATSRVSTRMDCGSGEERPGRHCDHGSADRLVVLAYIARETGSAIGDGGSWRR